MLAQTVELDIWRHPITLLVVAFILGAIGTAVGFALRQIIHSQREQDIKLNDLAQGMAVRNALDDLKASQSEDRIGRIEAEVQAARSEIAAVALRVDHALDRLGTSEARV